ncbi:putative 3-hydroxyacyl-CoA dehydrogenase [Roseibium sp. TrichSKD4]|uniref:hypothetical protein n=1 Tax=Roseibium sp. TrichSKD4 TaxID=744980 RepID=UPI0001E571A8|nr:hypothetical protein [Roseibium sp. TrichSKD4]EFO28750.1 putative 3-hydroxyacyl-CoA dehydrogenase [Roseibium sp. TrichSKD4]
MTQIDKIATPMTAGLPGVDFTRPGELGFGMPEDIGTQRVKTLSNAAWVDAVDKVAIRFPGVAKSRIALAIFATYAARLSEDRAAVFALADSTSAGNAPTLVLAEFGLAPDKTFANVLEDATPSGVLPTC